MMKRSGSFVRQITIEKKQAGQDATYGAPTVTWVPLVEAPGSPVVAERFWAEVVDVLPSRSESVVQDLKVGRNLTRIRMRWRNDVTPDMRVTVHGDTDVVYQIIAGPAEIEGRKGRIELLCERYSS